MRYSSVLVTLALASAATAQQGAEEGFMSLVSKWETISGFAEFHSSLNAQLIGFVATQTFISDPAAFTETDPAALATNPAALSFGEDVISVMSAAVETDTNLSPDAKATIVSDFESFTSAFAGAAASGGPAPTGTDALSPEPTVTDGGLAATDVLASDTFVAVPSVTGDAVPTEPSSNDTVASAVPTQTANVGFGRMDMLSISGAMAGLVAAVAIAL